METEVPAEEGQSRYCSYERIGEGGLGEIFRAWDSHMGRWVAIKRMRRGLDKTANTTGSLVDESRKLAALQHPNILTVYDFGEDQEGLFVVTEFLEGRTLEQWTQGQSITLEAWFPLAQQTLEALTAAHHIDLIHRDLKPANIMVLQLPSEAVQFKVLDFGLAKFQPKPSSQTMVMEDTIMGSVDTIAPEQINRGLVDSRTDLYAMGCVYYYALTGKYPFTGETIPEMIVSHLEHHVIPLGTHRPDLPPPVCEWVMRLIMPSSDDRPKSARVALQELRGLMSPSSVSPPSRMDASEARQVSRGFLWTALVIALLLGAVAVLLYRHAKAAAPAPAAGSTVAAVPQTNAPSVPVAESHTEAGSPVAKADGVFLPTDLGALRAHLNQKVVVEGRVEAVGQSDSKTVRYLNFDRKPRAAIALVFFVVQNKEDFSDAKLNAYVGQRVRAEGKVSDFKGALQMVVDRPSQIQVLKETR